MTAVILILPGGEDTWSQVIIIYAAMFIFGLTSAGRTAIGYVYLMELCPKDYHSAIGTFWNCTEGMIYVFLTIYFSIFKGSWVWPTVFSWFQGILCTLIIFFYFPESPKWLYDKRKFKQC
jgi:MFS family permease